MERLLSSGLGPAESMFASLKLAQICESVGYSRYWVGEHHTSDSYSSNPCLLVPLLASVTRSMRVGFGGMIAGYQSPRWMAETAFALSELFPKRIDVGVCKGPGVAFREVSLELARGDEKRLTHEAMREVCFALNSFFQRRLASCALASDPGPKGVLCPDMWVLGSSINTARLAEELEAPFALSFLSRGTNLTNALDEYGSPIRVLAVSIICAETTREAACIGADIEALGLLPHNLMGSPDDCATALRKISADRGVEEFIVSNWIPSAEARARSFELLAKAVTTGVPANAL